MHGAVEHHGRGHSAQPQRADEGRGLPMAMSTGARQRCPRKARPERRAILVEAPVSSTKTSFSGSSPGLGFDPRRACDAARQGALLLAGVCRFF